MWIRGAGALFLFLAGVSAGFLRAERARNRAKMLEEMVQFLHAAQANLRYRRDKTQDLLEELCAHTRLPLVLAASPLPFPQRLDSALSAFESSVHECGVTPQECGRFRAALVQLGTAGAQEEEQQLAYAASMLSEACDTARSQAATEQKLYRALGVAAGAAAALLVL